MFGCSDSPATGPTPTPSPTPSGLPGVVIGARTGVTQITLADATPLPGATLTGPSAALGEPQQLLGTARVRGLYLRFYASSPARLSRRRHCEGPVRLD